MGEATKTPGRVWEAFRSSSPVDHTFVGYLVSEAGDPHRPIVAVIAGELRTKADYDRGYDLAARIAERPEVLNRDVDADPFLLRDLRHFCRPDTLIPFPAEMFGWRIGPVGGGATDVFPFFPFCRFRLARMVAAFVQLEFTPEQREKCPGVSIDITEGGDCGSYYSSSIQIPGSQIPL